jgi:antitoxin component of MazEF toxin-antitoxin module
MDNQDCIEIRKVQALQAPKEFATELGVRKGDFLKCQVDKNRLIVEKVNP